MKLLGAEDAPTSTEMYRSLALSYLSVDAADRDVQRSHTFARARAHTHTHTHTHTPVLTGDIVHSEDVNTKLDEPARFSNRIGLG